MLWADASSLYHQTLDPLQGIVPGSAFLSTLAAALPVLTLFYLLVPRRWMASKAGAAGAVVAIVIAILVFRMPVDKAIWSFGMGVGFGLLPVGWTIFCAMLLYNMTVETGKFSIIRRSIAGLSGDARIQALLIGFSFGAFLEGAAGGGTPVAICGAIMVGLGFHPFLAAVLCLIANTSPVAYGGLGTPIIVLGGVTGIPNEALSIMAGHQLPFVSFVIPLWMVRCMCTWKQTWEVWPALLVSGGSFALFQYFFATMHQWVPGLVLYPMTDIGGGIFSMVVMAVFLQFWKPKKDWHFTPLAQPTPEEIATELDPFDPHAAEAASLAMPLAVPEDTRPLTLGRVTLAWAPFVLMSVFLMGSGIVRQMENRSHPGSGGVYVPGTHIATNYNLEVPTLHELVFRDARLSHNNEPKPEEALFNFAWVTSPGSPVFAAALVSIFLLRMNLRQLGRVIVRTCVQMKIPIPTIAFMLGLSYVTRYAGMDSTLGYAFSGTGMAYPFFAAVLGWIGVFLTGTDAGSNALFGSLQQITANLLHSSGAFAGSGHTVGQAQVLICTANSTGGVMGKMIDAQSICVATAATDQIGKEADIFKAVLKHSMILVAIIGAISLLQAYVPPFTHMVPDPAAMQTK
ncbi:MAG TPA: L-lactate permease [Gemmataceae bacterium]|nr:L-lactate permease [Gemmataceae bacterium]